MPYAVKPIPFKPHRLEGLSARLLESHYENNYGGAVRRLNAIEQRLAALDWAKASVFEINGLKREELIAINSMILHEVYFDGIGEDGGAELPGALAAALTRDFGDVERWRAEFTAMGKALAGGSGWVLLTWSERQGRLVNQWAADHAHTLASGAPILALDMYEHAYHMDFGTNAGAYVDAFMRNLHWGRVARRFAAAVGGESPPSDEAAHEVSVSELRELLQDKARAPLVLDVRHLDDLERSGQRLPDTPWRDSGSVDGWADELPKDRLIVVYCMYGFWVSRDTAAALRGKGYDARTLQGGIAAWRAMGLPTTPIARAGD